MRMGVMVMSAVWIAAMVLLLIQRSDGTGSQPSIREETSLSGSEVLSANGHLRTNQACIEIIKESESLRTEAYVGPAGEIAIGYGHTKDVTLGMTISAAQAEVLLKEDLQAVETALLSWIDVAINENEFSAMVCLAYNIGTGNFRSSTVLAKLNENKRQEAADAFLLWNKSGGEVNEHLSVRRASERALFLTPE